MALPYTLSCQMMTELKKRVHLTDAQLAEFAALIDDFGLVPSILITEELIRQYVLDVRVRMQDGDFTEMEKCIARDYCKAFFKNLRSVHVRNVRQRCLNADMLNVHFSDLDKS